MNFTRRALPPFGRSAKPDDGWIWVRCGERAWELTRKDPLLGNCVIFPKGGHDPAEYRWPVEGAEVIAFQLDEELRPFLLLIAELLRQGARRVHACYTSEGLITYDPESDRRAA